ncbi:MAG: glycosyl transferase [Williamsia sp.]|nr:glycosyl transferase [Williamsia sp.]
MKIAHLILAHKNPQQLLYLIEALQHPQFYFYIHIDKKKDDAPFKSLIRKSNVFFIEKRTEIHWGDWGTIQATLNGFEVILPKGYDYVNVISAQDFPIKSADHIHKYFSDRKGTEFITCDFIEGDWSDVESRITNYHLINWRVPGKFRLGKILTKLLPPRVFPIDYDIVGRANWFTLTNEAARYIVVFLREHPELVRYFKYCWGADEFIFSTVLYNSHFKEKIQNNLVYVDWNVEGQIGHPKLLKSEDFERLKASDKLFARKFDMDVDATVLAMLQELNGSPKLHMSNR